MCGILGIFKIKENERKRLSVQIRRMSQRQRHRGPDWTGYYQGEQALMAHERLSIVDVLSGQQPLYSSDGSLVLLVNGEIYNHLQLRKEFPDYNFSSQSDCEVILPLYMKYGTEIFQYLRGMYAFVIFDEKNNKFLIARDHIGIMPLYYGYDKDAQLYVGSELKTINEECSSVQVFPPGCYLTNGDEQAHTFYQPSWYSYDVVKDNRSDLKELKTVFEDAVHSHMMSDVPYGVLLSGGLDSSLVAAAAVRFAPKRVESDDQQQAWWPRLHSFAVGLSGSPDLKAAAEVASYLGTVHHSFHFTVEEGIAALEDVIYHLETFDVTTVRAATPMYLMARRIKAMGIKMVLSGEGADEVFGGYLYFHYAPNGCEFHQETVRKLQRLHLYDCLRANKAMSAWGVEARVPFLDRRFLEVAMRLKPEDKMVSTEEPKIEKRILRQAFDDGRLPKALLWRQKEQFSDGVGYSWIDGLKEYAESEVTTAMFVQAAQRFPLNPPTTKEAYLYRQIFEYHFGSGSALSTVPVGESVACSTEVGFRWMQHAQDDPSGRAIKHVHKAAYVK